MAIFNKKKSTDEVAEQNDKEFAKHEQRRNGIKSMETKLTLEESGSRWRGSQDVIVRVLSKAQLANRLFFWKKVNLLPGEAALWLNNGKLVKIATEGQIVASGVWDRLKDMVSAGSDMVLMMMDTGERTLQFRLGVNKDAILARDPDFFERVYEAYGSRRALPKRYSEAEAESDFREAHESGKKPDQLEKIQHSGYLSKVLEVAEKKSLFELTKDDIDSLRAKGLNLDARDLDNSLFAIECTQKAAESHAPILTKDRQSVVFEVGLTVNFRPERSAEVFKLLRASVEMTEADIIDLIRIELETRVFGPKVSLHTIDEIRNNPEVAASLQSQAQEELFSWLHNYGIHLSRLTIHPEMTDEERLRIIDAEKEALVKASEKQHERDLAAMKREFEIIAEKESLSSQMTKLAAQNNEEVRVIARAAEMLDAAHNLSLDELQLKLEATRKEYEIEGQRKEEELRFWGLKVEWELERDKLRELWDLESQRMTLEAQIRRDDAEHLTNLQITHMQALGEVDRQMIQLESELHLRDMQMRNEQSLLEQDNDARILSIVADAKALTPEVAQEVYRQKTMRKALDNGTAATASVSNAEGQRYAKNNFQEGIKSVPGINVALRGQALMQSLPPQSMPGGMGMQQAQPSGQWQAPQYETITCPECSMNVIKGNVCSNCGHVFNKNQQG